MKILLINIRYGYVGGPERYLFNLKELLESKEHSIIPFSIKYSLNEQSEYQEYFVSPLSDDESVYFKNQSWNFKTVFKTIERNFYSPEVERNLTKLIADTKPDFAIPLYPGHLWSGEGMELKPWNRISPNAPPTLIIQAEDDPVDDVRNSIAYFLALKEAKVPVEMHIYAHGGHAFGIRRTAQPITAWPDLAMRWLHTIGMM